MSRYKCFKCGTIHEDDEINGISANVYEYRGAHACEGCFEDVVTMRDKQRAGIIKEEHNKTEVFRGLDMTDSIIGKANRKLLKPHMEIATKESQRLKDYEGR